MQVITIGIGLSAVEAAKKALLHFVGKLQLLKNQGGYRATSDSRELLPGFSPRASFVQASVQESRFWEAEATPQDVEQYLERADTMSSLSI